MPQPKDQFHYPSDFRRERCAIQAKNQHLCTANVSIQENEQLT